jgi:hypothetical protein
VVALVLVLMVLVLVLMVLLVLVLLVLVLLVPLVLLLMVVVVAAAVVVVELQILLVVQALWANPPDGWPIPVLAHRHCSRVILPGQTHPYPHRQNQTMNNNQHPSRHQTAPHSTALRRHRPTPTQTHYQYCFLRCCQAEQGRRQRVANARCRRRSSRKSNCLRSHWTRKRQRDQVR